MAPDTALRAAPFAVRPSCFFVSSDGLPGCLNECVTCGSMCSDCIRYATALAILHSTM